MCSPIQQNTEINTWIWCVASIFKQWTPGPCNRFWSFLRRFWVHLVRPEFFYKFGWVFYKFTENGEFFNRWFLLLRGKNRDACPLVWEIVLKFILVFSKPARSSERRSSSDLQEEKVVAWCREHLLFIRLPTFYTHFLKCCVCLFVCDVLSSLSRVVCLSVCLWCSILTLHREIFRHRKISAKR